MRSGNRVVIEIVPQSEVIIWYRDSNLMIVVSARLGVGHAHGSGLHGNSFHIGGVDVIELLV